MIMAQNEKSTILISAVSATNGATVSGYIDTQDFDYATIDVCSTTSDSTANNFSVLTLSEGLVSNAFTAITAFSTDGFTVANADTDNPQVVARLNVRLDKRERYLRLQCSPTTTQTIWANARLGYKDETPTSVAALGVGVAVTG
jgi:hypothetical protein